MRAVQFPEDARRRASCAETASRSGMKHAGDEAPSSLMHAEDRKRIGSACRSTIAAIVVCRDVPGSATGHRYACLLIRTLQISAAYCRIVRSDENQPIRAVLRIVLAYQRGWIARARRPARWAAA